MMRVQARWSGWIEFSGAWLAAFSSFSLCCGGCNLAIGLEKQDLPRKEVTACTTNEDCNDFQECTQDQCELPQGTCTHYLMSEGTLCRDKPAENLCDIEPEYCDGSGYDCPEDTFEPATLECRPAAGPCDEPEFCTGDSPLCPEDAFSNTEKTCDDENDCTYDDRCDGEGSCAGINGLHDAVQVSIGPWGMFTCAFFESGQLRCWGNNNYGQLGDGTDVHQYIPTTVLGLPETDPVVQLAAGGRHVNVLLASGRIMAWGLGDTGQLGDGNEGPDYEAHSPVEVVGVPDGWRYVASGYLFNCGVQEDNSAYCWGRNDVGQLGTGAFENAASPVPVVGLGEIETMASGNYHVCAIDLSGSVWCWGRNDRGQLGIGVMGDPVTLPAAVGGLSGRIIDVACGVLHTCALRENGDVLCWGTNEYGQLGAGDMEDSDVPVVVSGLPATVVDIDSEYEHTCALLEGGGMMCWGHNEEGQIGESALGEVIDEPVSIDGLPSAVVEMAVGAHHTCVLPDDTTVYCWGHNAFGELGNGSSDIDNNPVPTGVLCE